MKLTMSVNGTGQIFERLQYNLKFSNEATADSYTFHEFFEMEFSIKLLYCRSKISKTRMATSSVKNPHEELVL